MFCSFGISSLSCWYFSYWGGRTDQWRTNVIALDPEMYITLALPECIDLLDPKGSVGGGGFIACNSILHLQGYGWITASGNSLWGCDNTQIHGSRFLSTMLQPFDQLSSYIWVNNSGYHGNEGSTNVPNAQHWTESTTVSDPINVNMSMCCTSNATFLINPHKI
jgi:hypothetical protein